MKTRISWLHPYSICKYTRKSKLLEKGAVRENCVQKSTLLLLILLRMPTARYGCSTKFRIFFGFAISVLICSLFLRSNRFVNAAHRSLGSAVVVYKSADTLRINNIQDPLCEWSTRKRIYVCSGHCPWVTTKIVKCTFLSRIINTHFQQHGMYCTPPPDGCPSHNAWLKEDIPLTLNPVRTIPTELLSNFTLNDLITVNYQIGFQFLNYSGSGLNWSINYLNMYRNQVRQRQPFGTYNTLALYPVLDTYREIAVTRRSCAVIGSEFPWIEAALLEFDAATVTTIEYNRIATDVPNLFTTTPHLFAATQKTNSVNGKLQLFDSVWSYSSLEHDGLGRYTDPINPYGDLQTMIKISCMLKPGGLLFLAVPTSKYDSIHFNLHRVYGPIRLPLLYRYFHLVQVFGEGFNTDPNNYVWQPILVLQNKVGCRWKHSNFLSVPTVVGHSFWFTWSRCPFLYVSSVLFLVDRR